ncbi:hypothetical protein BDFB_013314 [Asbolus verrucosus]|uniref:Uncharacterized protein n=1 Tax=Asbolus verrucosus TaxID=1661398 RepID=A0A482V633_ASBVE|nr:hypothetical protein BDFB_013314 [Asbolus verrucosus]
MREISEKVKENLLPEKSRNLYMKAYVTFTNWCSSKNINLVSKDVLLAYFQDYAGDKKASTLWAHYSMLKSTISLTLGCMTLTSSDLYNVGEKYP